MFPKPYKIKWRLLNALIKFLEILNKDLEKSDVASAMSDSNFDLIAERDRAKLVSARWSPKAIISDMQDVRGAWERGRESLDKELAHLVDIISSLGTLISRNCLPDVVQAYTYIVAMYNNEFYSTYCGLEELTDKQLVKALNTLRARKDLVLVH